MGVDSGHLQRVGTGTRAGDAAARTQARSGVPLLEPAAGGSADRFARRVGDGHPVRVFLAAVLAGYVLLVGLMVALGLLLTHVILHIGGVYRWDEHVNRWMASNRTSGLVDASWVGSTLAGGLVIPVVVGVLLLAFLLTKHWRLAAFTLFVICVESGSYRATSLVVHRDRPRVHRLESLPVDASYPSGHTAAALALYGGLLILLASRVRNTAVRVVCWALVVAVPLFVAWSRMERGMHHVTDTAAAALMGACALGITVFAARAAGAAADRRDGSGA